jgi:hypothetical protein
MECPQKGCTRGNLLEFNRRGGCLGGEVRWVGGAYLLEVLA